MPKTKARIYKSKAHKKAKLKRDSFKLCYTLEIPDEPELAALIRFVYWYLRLKERLSDTGYHPSFVVTRATQNSDYPTEGQTQRLSLAKEVDEKIGGWIRERV